MTARLHVDLGALTRNIDRVRAVVAPADLMLVVKDDAYGHGLAPVATAAARAGVRWFGAFDVHTGAAVRRAVGPDARVFSWIAASREDVAVAVAESLDLGIGDGALLEEVAAVARAAGRRARVHLKIDSGLHRNGVRPEDWPAFTARAAQLVADGGIDVVGVWSHIAEASDDEDDLARAAYDAAVEQARATGLTPGVRHLAASAAAFARAEFRYDMVRVGAFCYGIRSAGGPAAAELGLETAARLEADVVAVGADGVTVGIGALEGLPSSLAGKAAIGTPAGPRRILEIGERTLVEGWTDAAPGDRVIVYGPGRYGESTATDLAEVIGTIGEEIAVRVSPLVPRVYAGE